ncbi:MAG: 5'-nucleotidase C-terminal domain-containing protein [Cyclobacteriaceae bacterium]
MALRFLFIFIGFCLGTACTPQLSLTNLSKETSLTVDSNIPPDPVAASIIAPYKTQLDQEMSTVIGQATYRMEKQSTESSLGNLVADIIFETGTYHYSKPIDLSIVSLGEINSSLAKGPILKSDIYELMPAEHKLFILELNHIQIQELVEYQVKKKDLSVGNAVLVVKDSKPLKFYIGGQPFDRQKTYTLAVSDFLAHGGGGMTFLKQAKRLQKVEITIRDLIFDYLAIQQQEGKSIEAIIEGRIKILP